MIRQAHENYVRARARGAGRLEAYVAAGYKPNETSAGRLERRPEVAARLAELRERDPDNAAPAAVIVRLLRLADTCSALSAAPALKEARLALMDAHRTQTQLSATREEEDEYPPLPPELTEEQWILRYGAPESKQEVLAGEWRDQYARHGWRADDPLAAPSEIGS